MEKMRIGVARQVSVETLAFGLREQSRGIARTAQRGSVLRPFAPSDAALRLRSEAVFLLQYR